jgi:hypothetical protein
LLACSKSVAKHTTATIGGGATTKIMDDAAIENPAIVAATSNSTTGSSTSEKETKQRYAFPKIEKKKLENGNIIVTNPFLEKSTKAELAFCRLLAVEKPFIAPHGSKGTVWKGFISQINEQRGDDNKLLYDPPITERYAKDRVTEYFAFVKKKIAATPFNSGCDDEDEPCELLQLIEDLYEQNESFESEAKKKKNAAERNKLESEAIRTGNLAGFKSKDKPNVDIAAEEFIVDINAEQQTPKPKPNGNGSSDSSCTSTAISKRQSSGATKSSRGSGMEDSISSFGAISKRHLDIAAEKEINKKLKYELKLKIIDEKKARREEKLRLKAIQQEEEAKNKAYERERNEKMLEALLSLHKKNAE